MSCRTDEQNSPNFTAHNFNRTQTTMIQNYSAAEQIKRKQKVDNYKVPKLVNLSAIAEPVQSTPETPSPDWGGGNRVKG